MKISLKRALITAVFSAVFMLNAQVSTVAFREFDSDEFLSRSMSLGENGLVMYGMENSKSIVVKLMDTGLQDQKTWNISLDRPGSISGMAWVPRSETIAMLVTAGKNRYKFITIRPDERKFKVTDMELPAKTSLSTGMLVVGEEIWLGATAKKTGQMLFRIPVKSPRLNSVNADLVQGRTKYSVRSIQVLDNDEVAVVFHYGPKKMRELDVCILSSKGKIENSALLANLSTEQRAKLLDAKVTWLGEGDYSLTGTFHKAAKKMIGNGVFFARYTGEKVRYLSMFDYTDFEHFNDWMRDNQQEKLEKKIAKKKAQGKEVTQSRLSVEHSAIITESGLLFIAEYFYPTYRTETTTQWVNGRPQTVTRRVFDGFQYTNGMAVGISNDGEKLFDQNIPLAAPYKPFSPIRFLHVSSDSSVVRLLHTSGRLVLSSTISGSEVTNNQWTVTHTIPEGQREKWTSSASLYWYGNTFFIMEQQKTREKGLLKKGQIRYYGAAVRVD